MSGKHHLKHRRHLSVVDSTSTSYYMIMYVCHVHLCGFTCTIPCTLCKYVHVYVHRMYIMCICIHIMWIPVHTAAPSPGDPSSKGPTTTETSQYGCLSSHNHNLTFQGRVIPVSPPPCLYSEAQPELTVELWGLVISQTSYLHIWLPPTLIDPLSLSITHIYCTLCTCISTEHIYTVTHVTAAYGSVYM